MQITIKVSAPLTWQTLAGTNQNFNFEPTDKII